MGAQTITAEVTLQATSCAACGIQFAAPDWFIRARVSDGKTLYCPNGHDLAWHETDADRLRKKLDEQTREATRQAARATQAQQERDAANAMRIEAERKLKRVQSGVCPCCSRTFQDLQRHMVTKHPQMKAGPIKRSKSKTPHVAARLAEIRGGKS